MSYPQMKSFGSNAVLLEWPSEISPAIQEEVRQFSAFIEDTFFKEIIETVITYQALAVYLRAHVSPKDFIASLHNAEWTLRSDARQKKLIKLPVCYADEMAPDLRRVAHHNQIGIEEAIELHSEQTYKVAFIGFLPGFAYLNGLHKTLHTPRLEFPRRHVPKGSVAIGGMQTGIYPHESPGGWNIIGRCPLLLFDAEKKNPCLLNAGDNVRFQEVSKSVYEEIEQLASKGLYQPETVYS